MVEQTRQALGQKIYLAIIKNRPACLGNLKKKIACNFIIIHIHV